MFAQSTTASALPLVLGVAALAFGTTCAPAQAAKPASMNDCFHDLEHGSTPDIVCEFPLQPSAAERAEMAKQTAGYLKDASCTVSIRIARALVSAAIDTPDYQFDAPPQPVACRVTMPGKTGPDKTGDVVVPISGSFAPKVTIKDGVAIKASPGLDGIAGVPRFVSYPIAAYINRAGFLRDGMLKMVNAWLVHLRAAKARAG